MACLDYTCVNCGWWESANDGRILTCPVCGGRVKTTFDETPVRGGIAREEDWEAGGDEDEYEPPDDEEDEESPELEGE